MASITSGGWIVLDDARQRDAIILDGHVIENPTTGPSTGEAGTSLGTFGTTGFRRAVALGCGSVSRRSRCRSSPRPIAGVGPGVGGQPG